HLCDAIDASVQLPQRLGNRARGPPDLVDQAYGKLGFVGHGSPVAALLQRLGVRLDEPADEPDVVKELAHEERAGPVVVCAVVGHERTQGACRGVVPTASALPQPQPFFTVSSMSAPA